MLTIKRLILILQLYHFATICTIVDAQETAKWKWICNDETENCEKISNDNNNNNGNSYGNIGMCRLVCGKYGALWPRPTLNCTMSKQLIMINPNTIAFELLQTDVENYLIVYKEFFLDNIKKECNTNCNEIDGQKLIVKISLIANSLNHNWNTSEHYTLDLTTTDDNLIIAKINAENYYGGRHGLETLSQLFTSHRNNLYIVNRAYVDDKPIYRHRGLLLDTARNYLNVDVIKKHIRAMAASKLNVLHWHATDTQSFPLDLPQVPQLARYGAYAAKKIYNRNNIRDVIDYARLHGIRVIIEIDAPSHAGNGWQWGPKENLGELAVCVNQQPWRYFCIQPPCGQLNPINNNVYKILRKLYGDLLELLPGGEAFHMGGDEVFYPCWNSSRDILHFMETHKWGTSIDDYLKLWAHFQERALKEFDNIVGDSTTPIILWSSDLTEPDNIEKYLNKDRYVIETWVPGTSNLPDILIEKGYKLIISTKDAWYLDHGFWGNTLYHNWQVVYNNRLLQHKNVLGGEVCMWGELVDGTSIDSKVWPRAAAAAERLWSNPNTDSIQATKRFLRHRERLVSRGIMADAVVPRWCYQNDGDCY